MKFGYQLFFQFEWPKVKNASFRTKRVVEMSLAGPIYSSDANNLNL